MTSSTPLKILALAALVCAALYAGHAWLGEPPATAGRDDAPPVSPPAAPARSVNTAPPADRTPAAAIAQAYARSPQEADARFKGQRLSFQGVVEQTEAGQGRILLVTLGASEGHAGLRAVVDMATQFDKAVRPPTVGQALSLSCFNQGMLMGDPVLIDCQIQP